MNNTPEETLKSTLANVLTNVSNYPDDVQARLLGANLSKIIDAAVEAVLATGLIERRTVTETFDQMVDRVLEYNRTPRRDLFEYPHRADDSRELIRSAEELVRSLTVDVEKVNTVHDRPLVDRVEVIDNRGRAYTNYWVKDVSTSLQDNGRTLKIFVSEGEYA